MTCESSIHARLERTAIQTRVRMALLNVMAASSLVLEHLLAPDYLTQSRPLAVQGKKRQGSPCSLGETDRTCDN